MQDGNGKFLFGKDYTNAVRASVKRQEEKNLEARRALAAFLLGEDEKETPVEPEKPVKKISDFVNIGIDSITFVVDLAAFETFLNKALSKTLRYKRNATKHTDKEGNAWFKATIGQVIRRRRKKIKPQHETAKIFTSIYIYSKSETIDKILKDRKKGEGTIVEIQINGICQPQKAFLHNKKALWIVDALMRHFKTRTADICMDYEAPDTLTKGEFIERLNNAGIFPSFNSKRVLKVKGTSTFYFNCGSGLFENRIMRIIDYDKYAKTICHNRIQIDKKYWGWRRLEFRVRIDAFYKEANEIIGRYISKLRDAVKALCPQFNFSDDAWKNADLFKFIEFQKDRRKKFLPFYIEASEADTPPDKRAA